MPVLNEQTAINRGFDEYELAPAGSNLATQIESLSLSINEQRTFVFINASETHYPYCMPRSTMPRVSGINGALLRSGSWKNDSQVSLAHSVPFSDEKLSELRSAQVKATELADERLTALLDLLPKPLLFIALSDHGELFGEDGFFGHGPFFHPVLFDVPLAMGLVT